LLAAMASAEGDAHRSRTGLVHMASEEHASVRGRHLECPERVRVIMQRLAREGVAKRCTFVESREVDQDELHLTHAEAYVEKMRSVEKCSSQQEFDALSQSYPLFDSYFTRGTFKSACVAAGGILELVKGVLAGDHENGFAVIRPPGHHVEYDECRGFGIFNNVAVAAVTARVHFGVPRVLIVDWDVYHGTGTQHLFEEDATVLYFSAHRFDNGSFFPGSKSASAQSVGQGHAKGLNVNVAWNGAGMGDDEYLAAWQCVLLPIAKEFRPDLILVSAGFSAAKGDVGGCSLSPEGFGQMTRMLMRITPRVVLILEGGYDLSVIPDCAAACTKALLGDRLQWRTEVAPKREARIAIEQTLRSQRPFWSSLSDDSCINVMTTPAIQLEDLSVLLPRAAADAAQRKASAEAVPDDIAVALQQMQALQEKLQLFSQDFRTEEEDELRWQLEEVNQEIKEMMAMQQSEESGSKVYTPQRKVPHPEAVGGQKPSGGYGGAPQRPPNTLSSDFGACCGFRPGP